MAGQPRKRQGQTHKAQLILSRPKVVEDVPAPPKKVQRSAAEVRSILDGMGIDQFCDLYISGKSLRDIGDMLGVSSSTLLRWLEAEPARQERYARAREEAAEALASEIISIADEAPPITAFGSVDSAAVQHQRLRLEARKWVASKLKPRTYGDKLDVTSGGDRLSSLSAEQIDMRLQHLLARAGMTQDVVSGGGKDGSASDTTQDVVSAFGEKSDIE